MKVTWSKPRCPVLVCGMLDLSAVGLSGHILQLFHRFILNKVSVFSLFLHFSPFNRLLGGDIWLDLAEEDYRWTCGEAGGTSVEVIHHPAWAGHAKCTYQDLPFYSRETGWYHSPEGKTGDSTWISHVFPPLLAILLYSGTPLTLLNSGNLWHRQWNRCGGRDTRGMWA